jgi:TRAP-type C4-dicarboxylate transport system substrate-binding protein
MRMKVGTSLKALLASATITLAGTTALTGAETLRWGEHLPQCCSMYAVALEWMVDEVAERSGGELKIEVSWGGVLATVGEIPTAVEHGVIDMGNIVTPYFPDQFVINNAIPFFWPQPRSQGELGELMLKWHEEIPAFGAELARYNLHLISVRPLPPYGMICTGPIRTLADFRGKRIRSYGVALPAMLEALGAVPVSLSDVEAYEAMRNGILDCSVGDIPLVDAFQWDEVGRYFIDLPMGASWGHLLVMNADRYAALSDLQKAVLDGMKRDHLDELLRLFAEVESNIRAKWAAEGSVEVIAFPAEEFLAATLGNPKVQAVRASWLERAVAAGMPEADAARVVAEISD